jgi:hypothetical protein
MALIHNMKKIMLIFHVVNPQTNIYFHKIQLDLEFCQINIQCLNSEVLST